MAKQVIIAGFEEMFGEYILNMSKENLKIAALRGRIKLENVQLDGDMIGAHALNTVGLQSTSFGILSCSVQSINIIIPWNNLEQEPSKMILEGVSLVCVPLVPLTANQRYGAGTKSDPRCTLRTRSKRLLLSRLERNFWNGQYADQGGPPLKRIERAVDDIRRDMQKQQRASHKKAQHSQGQISVTESSNGSMTEDNASLTSGDDSNLGVDWLFQSDANNNKNNNNNSELPELPRDWKVKIREKMMRNMEASIHNLHIRVEVSEKGLDFNREMPKKSGQPPPAEDEPRARALLPEERAFCFGFTLESLVVHTASENWKAGSHDTSNPLDGTQMSSVKGHLGPNEYVVKNNKIGSFKNLSLYWDEEPPLLLAETNLCRGIPVQKQKMTLDKWQARVASAMSSLFSQQEPGQSIRQSLGAPALNDVVNDHPHIYVCKDLNSEIRVRTSDRTLPGPISCSADVVPLNWDFSLRPHQYKQYNLLRMAIQRQQRFDTMLRQRPSETPEQNPRAWWQYAIGCVTARPNSRPWEDVKIICNNRSRYIELVIKKNKHRISKDSIHSNKSGEHAALSDSESEELLSLEELLPLEALQAFHLISLRSVYDIRKSNEKPQPQPIPRDRTQVERHSRPRGLGRFRFRKKQHRRRNSRGSASEFTLSSADEETGNGTNNSSGSEDDDQSQQQQQRGEQTTEARLPTESPSKQSESEVSLPPRRRREVSLFQAMTLRLGNKVWFVDWRFHNISLNISMVVDDSELARLNLRSRGNVRSYGRGKRDLCFDITQCDIVHSNQRILSVKSDDDQLVELDEEFSVSRYHRRSSERSLSSALSSTSLTQAETFGEMYQEVPTIQSLLLETSGRPCFKGEPDLELASRYLNLPPSGVACRVVAGMNTSAQQKISISSHPATFLWTNTFLDGLHRFQETNPDIGLYMRNAATPLARKAQLALISPGSRAIYLNVMAPKVRIPIASQYDLEGGTLIMDAGIVRMQGEKVEGEQDMAVQFRANDLQANFLRSGRGASTVGSNAGDTLLWYSQSAIGTDTSVIKPFNIAIDAHTLAVVDDHQINLGTNFQLSAGPLRTTEIHVSPICLNLVDAEILARTLGKLYGRTVARRRENRRETEEKPTNSKETVFQRVVDQTQHISLIMEKIELALEGHSRRRHEDCDRSTASLDSLHDSSPPVRAYLVSVDSIELNRTSRGDTAATHLTTQDASILRLRDTTSHAPFRKREDPEDSQYRILVRSGTSCTQPVLRASLLHDGRNHLDEVEIDIDSIVLRVTTTTLKDCVKAFRRVAEVAQIITREMERKVHEEGRKARKRHPVLGDRDEYFGASTSQEQAGVVDGRPPSPSLSLFTTETIGYEKIPQPSPKSSSDSSILFRVTLNESTLLAGRPTGAIFDSPIQLDNRSASPFAVIQVLSSALVMFQSIENPDGTGSKTLHVSIDDASSLVNTEFERVSPSQAPPMIGPTGAEFRVVYATENLGCVVSQDISLDCEGLKMCLTLNDAAIMSNITKSMAERLREISAPERPGVPFHHQESPRPVSSLLRYQKKGTGIATSIQIEILSVSFVLLKAYKSYLGSPEFLNFCLSEVKGQFEGCMSALSGESSAQLSINFFNTNSSDWEYALEPTQLTVEVDQMPNELVVFLRGADKINVNLTGALIQEIADLKFDFKQDRSAGKDGVALRPSILSTVGLRRATEARSVKVQNLTGFDLHVILDTTPFSPDTGLVQDGETVVVEALGTAQQSEAQNEHLSFNLRVASSASEHIGERESVFDLPVKTSTNQDARLYLLRPVLAPGNEAGRTSPETILTLESKAAATPTVAVEPVVEFCMHNQRICSSVSDLYSIPKGCDLLSGGVWSPADENNWEAGEFTVGASGPQSPSSHPITSPSSPRRDMTIAKSYWVKPYQSDAPEWTDMTCSLRLALERVMLPDNNWMWANEWTADVSGQLGKSGDADGWSYETSFESFSRKRRDYKVGDCVRRRRWTRTRMMKPPELSDPNRLLKFVWDPSVDANGNVQVVIRSPLRITNQTSGPLSFFLHSPSWPQHMPAGTAKPGDRIDVPVALASAVYMKIARTSIDEKQCADEDFGCSVMILPTSPTSSNFIRASMELRDVSSTVLHFLIQIKSERGIVDIIISPVVRIINLLPCSVECQIGEMLQINDRRKPDIKPAIARKGRPITLTDTMIIDSGSEGTFTAVNPWHKPHVSFRVPGFKWSLWQRINNRRRNIETWRPSSEEEEWCFAPKSDPDFADEHKTVVHFERWTRSGDGLLAVMSVECGHCPVVRLYAQFWILDRTGFGCHFAEGFEDMLKTAPDRETSRRSHLLPSDAKDPLIKKDMSQTGHQFSMGSNGMSLYFSKREKLTFVVERDFECSSKSSGPLSKWANPIDVSNVMPKTIVHVEEIGGSRWFEFAVSVSICPGIFSRTKLVTLVPRYKIINLLHRELIVAQDGCLDSQHLIPSHSSIPFHGVKVGSPKVRLSATSFEEPGSKVHDQWTNGVIRLDRVGITALRIPTGNNLSHIPMVVETEVRLASKEHPCAVVIVIWSANDRMHHPLYSIRNNTPYTILCRQPLQNQDDQVRPDNQMGNEIDPMVPACNERGPMMFHCGQEDVTPIILSFLGLDQIDEFVWIIGSGDVVCFGFDDPEKPHILEWTIVTGDSVQFDEQCPKAFLEVDAMGSSSSLVLSKDKEIKCNIGARHSTKVIDFTEEVPTINSGGEVLGSMKAQYKEMLKTNGVIDEKLGGHLKVLEVVDEDEDVGFGLRINLPGICVSVIDNSNESKHGREILLAVCEKISCTFSQTREGYHEFEFRLMSFQIDNHIQKSCHPVLLFCPPLHENEPHLHMSAVRRLQPDSSTYVFRYAAIRLLEVEVFLDRITAETFFNFIEPLKAPRDTQQHNDDPSSWAREITREMEEQTKGSRHHLIGGVELQSANSGRIYFEQFILHPIRLNLTFTQEWIEWHSEAESAMILQFIRGMASIANTPLTFTSFVVSHVFEAPQALGRVVLSHYASQLTKQIFAILGSLAILTAPADFISNVGTGVRDFFYEPINGAVHGPRQFIEGLEAGSVSLARGVFVGVVRGAANVTELLNANLVGLTADEEFIDERKAHQRLLTDALSRGNAARTFGDSLYLAGASVARSFRSGALGIVEQPTKLNSKHGPFGFVKGVGKALVGAVVKPVIGVGDAAVLVMNHMSDATSKSLVMPRIPKRLRRTLPIQFSSRKPNCVRLIPYDERAAKAQKIVTGGETEDDVYYGHLQIPSHLIITSKQCIWAIDRRSREPWCVNWEEVSHFNRVEGGVRVVVFTSTGLKSYTFLVDDKDEKGDAAELYELLSMHSDKMGNSSEVNSSLLSTKSESLSRHQIPGVKGRQVDYVFGSCNGKDGRFQTETRIMDDVSLVEHCFTRVKRMGSESATFFKNLDEEAWSLVTSWGNLSSGLSSKRCLVAGVINGTECPIQVKSTKLIQGGSPCYTIPTKEFDSVQGILHPGGCILVFGWGVAPSLAQDGNVFMTIETNAFISNLASFKSRDTFAEAMPGYQVGFLEKSVDDSGWWAKYWLLVSQGP